jgi:hypothetical protein
VTISSRFVVAAALVVSLGCSGSGGATSGTEGGHCYPNNTCNQGLSCFSNRCVRYDAGLSNADGDANDGAAAAKGVAGAAGMAGASGAAGATATAGTTGSAGATGKAGTTGTGGTTGAGGAIGVGGNGMGGGGGTKDDGGTRRDSSTDANCTDAGTGLDNLTVPSCGRPGAPSRQAYAGMVTITVSGIIQGAANVNSDAFYTLNSNDSTQAAVSCPACLVYNHFTEGSCVCPTECPTTSHFVTDVLVGGYPPFNPTHTYTVQLDLGSAASDRINFAYGDCGCYDNAGSYSLTIASESGGTCGD